MQNEIPIIGKKDQIDTADAIQMHIAAMLSMMNTHKVAIQLLNAQLDEHYKTEEHPSAIYMELVNCQITTHCAAVTQVSGQLALLQAMGIPGIPVPAEITYQQEGEQVQ